MPVDRGRMGQIYQLRSIGRNDFQTAAIRIKFDEPSCRWFIANQAGEGARVLLEKCFAFLK
jgi:hypothetical protein